jgi:hypothetical protein
MIIQTCKGGGLSKEAVLGMMFQTKNGLIIIFSSFPRESPGRYLKRCVHGKAYFSFLHGLHLSCCKCLAISNSLHFEINVYCREVSSIKLQITVNLTK